MTISVKKKIVFLLYNYVFNDNCMRLVCFNEFLCKNVWFGRIKIDEKLRKTSHECKCHCLLGEDIIFEGDQGLYLNCSN